MDYRKFLTADESLVLPYTGGPFVEAKDRRLRVAGELEPGWWTFSIKGRKAEAKESAFAPDQFYELPSVYGHAVDDWLFVSGREIECMLLMPEEELAPLAPVRARRWHSGEILFDCVEFEEEAEEQARLALEEFSAIAEVKGVGASLRAAYGFALTAELSRRLDIPVSPREVQDKVLEIAENGRPAAETLLQGLAAERAAHEARIRERVLQAQIRREESRRVRQRERARRDCRRRAEDALTSAGAQVLNIRVMGNDMMEVVFRFRGQRFISIANVETLNVHDSGICLDGADRQLTLDSLPSAINEAIDTRQLVITRRG